MANHRRIQGKLIHEYFAINLDIVWNTIQTDIPQLLAMLAPVVRECLEHYKP